MLSLEAVARFRRHGAILERPVGGSPVGFVGTELRVVPLDAVFTWALVVTFHLALSTRPTCGACSMLVCDAS